MPVEFTGKEGRLVAHYNERKDCWEIRIAVPGVAALGVVGGLQDLKFPTYTRCVAAIAKLKNGVFSFKDGVTYTWPT